MSRRASANRPMIEARCGGVRTRAARRLRAWMAWGLACGSMGLGVSFVMAQEPVTQLPPPKVAAPEKSRNIYLPGKPLNPPPTNMMPIAPKTPREQVLGAVPRQTAKVAEKYDKYFLKFIDTEASLELIENQTRLLILKETPKRIQLSNENVVEYNFLAKDQISLMGRAVGTATMTMWFSDPTSLEKEDILVYRLRVLPDPDYKKRLEIVYRALQDEINCAFPDSVICLHVVGDKVVVTGHAKDVAEVTQILKIIRANAPATAARGHSITAGIPIDRIASERDLNNPTEPVGQPLVPGVNEYLIEGPSWLVNMIKVTGEQTVNLRVTIAEVNRTAARSIGTNFTLLNNQGVPYFSQSTGAIATGGQVFSNGNGGIGIGLSGSGTGFIPGIPGVPFGTGYANILASLDNGQTRLAISALRNLNYAKLLTEPNLTTINGQTANFQAGGQFPVPVISGNYGGLGQLEGVQFQNYGIDLSFTPYITDRDRIRLALNANVTALDVSQGTTNIGGSQIPSLNQRHVNTTVEMREGQVLNVAGLVQNNLSGDAHKIPLFGDIPIIGQLFSFNRVTAGEQELVILVQPELVHPLDDRCKMPLPGMDLIEPTDCEFYLFGRIESHRDVDFRSPIRSDWQRVHNYRAMEANYISGPSGYSEVCPPVR